MKDKSENENWNEEITALNRERQGLSWQGRGHGTIYPIHL